MALYSNFPYSDYNNLNLDWIIKIVKELGNNFDKLDKDVQEALIKINTALDELDEAFNQKMEDFDNEFNSKISGYDEAFNQFLTDKEPEIDLIVNTYISENLSNYIAHAQYIENNETLKIGDGESGEIETPTVNISDLFTSDYANQLIAVAKNGFVYISFQSTANTYADYETMKNNNTPLLTIPEGYRPNYAGSQYYSVFIINNFASGNIAYRKSDGQVRINQLTPLFGTYTATTSGRIYFEIAYPYI